MIDLANPILAYIAVFFAGVVASVNPCVLVTYPLIVGYVGGYSGGNIKKAFWSSLVFIIGLSITYSILGTIAALSGKLIGNIGGYWKYILGVVAIVMGLELLGVIHLRMPGLHKFPTKQKGLLGALLLGLLFGLTASACSTPILGFVLTFVASKQNLVYGSTLLFTYALGSSLIILIVGVSTGAAQAGLRVRKLSMVSQYFPRIAGALFVLIGIWMIIL